MTTGWRTKQPEMRLALNSGRKDATSKQWMSSSEAALRASETGCGYDADQDAMCSVEKESSSNTILLPSEQAVVLVELQQQTK